MNARLRFAVKVSWFQGYWSEIMIAIAGDYWQTWTTQSLIYCNSSLFILNGRLLDTTDAEAFFFCFEVSLSDDELLFQQYLSDISNN